VLEEPDAKTQNKKERKDKTSILYQMCSPTSLYISGRNSYRDMPIPKWKIEKQLYSIADEISNKNLGVMLHLKRHKQTVVSKTVSPSFCRAF
jgi:hypothetical protein